MKTTSTSSRLSTVILGTLANLAAPLSTLVTGPLLARALGPSGRGLVTALLSPLALANLMFTLGVPEALIYFVASGRITAARARRIALLGGLGCALVAASMLLISSPYLFRAQPQSIAPFRLLLFTLPLSLVFSAVRGVAQAQQRFNLVNIERVTGALLRLLAICLLVLIHALTPLSAVWVSVVAPILASLVLLAVLRSVESTQRTPVQLGPFFHYAAAVATGTFGGLMIMRLDQVLMVSLTSPAELAYYSVAASLAELPLAAVAACRDLAFSLAAEQDNPHIIARFCRLTCLLVGIICLTGALVTPFALPLLFGRNYSPAIHMTQVLLLGTLGRAITTVIGAGLMTIRWNWFRSSIQMGGAALTAVLILALVPRWGGMAAAWVTTLTYAVLASVSLAVYVKASNLSLRQCLLPTRQDVETIKSACKVFLSAD